MNWEEDHDDDTGGDLKVQADCLDLLGTLFTDYPIKKAFFLGSLHPNPPLCRAFFVSDLSCLT